MCRRWSSSVRSWLVWTCLTACTGSVSGNGLATAGSPAAGGGGGRAQDPDSGATYQGDAGSTDAAGRADAALDVDPAECRPDPTDFIPCGGAITGQWRIASICIDDGLEQLREERECPELTQEFSSDYRMLVEFENNGDYTATLATETVQSVTLPFSCLPEGADCRSLLGADDTDDSDGQTLLVTMTDESCLIVAREQRALTEAGTWRISGSELTKTNATGPDTSEYCVTGNTLVSKNVNEVTGAVSWGVFERL